MYRRNCTASGNFPLGYVRMHSEGRVAVFPVCYKLLRIPEYRLPRTRTHRFKVNLGQVVRVYGSERCQKMEDTLILPRIKNGGPSTDVQKSFAVVFNR